MLYRVMACLPTFPIFISWFVLTVEGGAGGASRSRVAYIAGLTSRVSLENVQRLSFFMRICPSVSLSSSRGETIHAPGCVGAPVQLKNNARRALCFCFIFVLVLLVPLPPALFLSNIQLDGQNGTDTVVDHLCKAKFSTPRQANPKIPGGRQAKLHHARHLVTRKTQRNEKEMRGRWGSGSKIIPPSPFPSQKHKKKRRQRLSGKRAVGGSVSG